MLCLLYLNKAVIKKKKKTLPQEFNEITYLDTRLNLQQTLNYSYIPNFIHMGNVTLPQILK